LGVVIGEGLHLPEFLVNLNLGSTPIDIRAGFFFTSELKALLMAHSVLTNGGSIPRFPQVPQSLCYCPALGRNVGDLYGLWRCQAGQTCVGLKTFSLRDKDYAPIEYTVTALFSAAT